MSRQVELELVLQAGFDWESCAGNEKSQRREVFHRLLDQVFAPEAHATIAQRFSVGWWAE